MTKRDLLEVVIKILGVYCFILFVRFLPNLPMFFVTTGMDDYITNNTLYVLLTCLYPLINLALSYVFVIKTEMVLNVLRISGEQNETVDRHETPAYGRLSFWIRIIGLYYFVSSATKVASLIPALALDFTRTSTSVYHSLSGIKMWPQLIILALSLFFIFKNNKVEYIITRTKTKNTQPEDSEKPSS
ncbi:MAG: hypothetical protein PF692_15080 [Kiritimatiellae bacterium]|nr:hypothetical protein [Kiritimatiellia bacterium]